MAVVIAVVVVAVVVVLVVGLVLVVMVLVFFPKQLVCKGPIYGFQGQ